MRRLGDCGAVSVQAVLGRAFQPSPSVSVTRSPANHVRP